MQKYLTDRVTEAVKGYPKLNPVGSFTLRTGHIRQQATVPHTHHAIVCTLNTAEGVFVLHS